VSCSEGKGLSSVAPRDTPWVPRPPGTPVYPGVSRGTPRGTRCCSMVFPLYVGPSGAARFKAEALLRNIAYPERRACGEGGKGLSTGVPRGTPGCPGVPQCAPGRCAPGSPGIPRGAPGYPRVPRGTPRVPRSTPRYPGVPSGQPRGTPRSPGVPPGYPEGRHRKNDAARAATARNLQSPSKTNMHHFGVPRGTPGDAPGYPGVPLSARKLRVSCT
jgi:hypothetical protein